MPEQELFQKILGDVAANEEYGLVMKKWRELFGVTQMQVANELGVKPSVISDYESNRRKSPGIVFIRKYVLALLKLKSSAAHEEIKKQIDITKESNNLLIRNFTKPKPSSRIIRLFNAKLLTKNNDLLINGCVFFLDNISKLLTRLPTYKLLRELKKGGKYCYVFSNVKSGRIPLIMLSILSKFNKTAMPTLIIFQSNSFKMSNFAKKTAEKRNITLAVTNKDLTKLKKIIKEF